jgi:hypothetical protein
MLILKLYLFNIIYYLNYKVNSKSDKKRIILIQIINKDWRIKMPFDKNGTLVVRAFTAGGALPVAGTVVRIYGSDEENRFVEYSVLTDIDGVTESIALPAPNASLSQAPNPVSPSYAQYNIEVSADGFYTKRIFNVAVFDSEETVQPINMIPIPKNQNGVTYPRNNLNAVVRENEYLEM